jgi:hypothetical protein
MFQNQHVRMRKRHVWNMKLYAASQPPGDEIIFNITPAIIDDNQPNEEEICKALIQMRRNKSPGGSGLRVEHLLHWMHGAKEGENYRPECAAAWAKVLNVI